MIALPYSPLTLPATALLTAIAPPPRGAVSLGVAHLLPAGEFAARDGRPGVGRRWKVDDSSGAALASRMNAAVSAAGAAGPRLVDYEHQAYHARNNGKPVAAAGWMLSFAWRAGRGLFADVEWTKAARHAIATGEYRYASPVVQYDADTGAVLDVSMAALTNWPALLGLDELVADAAHAPPAGRPRAQVWAEAALATAAINRAAALTASQRRVCALLGIDEAAFLRDLAEVRGEVSAPGDTAALSTGHAALTDNQRHVCALLGIDQAAFLGNLANVQGEAAGQDASAALAAQQAAQLTENQRLVCRLLGVSPSAFLRN